MLIAHFSPNLFMAKFEKHVSGYEFLSNRCTKEIDVIYCGSVSELDKAMIAKEEFNKPLICWVWDLPYCWREWTRNNKDIRVHQWRDKYIKKTVSNLHKCDKVISASKYTQRVLRKRYNIESEQIYFYIDTEEFDAISTIKGEYIIQVSRFALNKRFDISIKAMSKLDKKLICVGRGNCNKLKILADDLHANVDFYCNKSREIAVELIKGAEVLVSPSLFEGWGVTPIEALYCGVPVLLSDLEVFKEIYGDEVPYHKKDDPDDMREKLQYLLNDKKLQRKIVENCRPIISEFTIDKFIEHWKKAIK